MASRQIKTSVDTKGTSLKIYWTDSLGGSPVMPLFLRSYADVIEKGWANPYIAWSNKNRAVWIETEDAKVIAGICYEFSPDNHMGWLVLSFVDEAYRGRRLYSLMREIVDEDLRKQGADRVCSLIHVDNESMLKSAERTGMRPQFYRMYKQLKA